jgi:copper chaperone NosL
MGTSKISILSKLMLLLGAVLMVISIFIPIWRIELDAPQYPEGLGLLIYANKIGGDVDIINGLNHYIGMQTLHSENFIEFTILPYIIGAYALLFLINIFIARKKFLYFTFAAFVLFGIVAMIDFWFWEYNYGHNLDPNAAIIVPGMAYQPPLIGFKQLLNFGAFSVPDIGGWLFIISGLLLLIAVLKETGFLNRFKKAKNTAGIIAIFSLFLISCNNYESEPIKLNKDNCDYCKMTITDGRFASELITKKGRIYKFDDIKCMLSFKNDNPKTEYHSFYINEFTSNNVLIPAEKAFYVKSQEIRSPMGGGIAAFSENEKASNFAKDKKTTVNSWSDISK